MTTINKKSAPVPYSRDRHAPGHPVEVAAKGLCLRRLATHPDQAEWTLRDRTSEKETASATTCIPPAR
jgi:hypothetical protein